MEHTLVIPEELYTDFAGKGKTPDQALIDLVRDAVEHEEQVEKSKQPSQGAKWNNQTR